MRKIEIIPKINGWIVKVGCKEVVFTDRQNMTDEISRYIHDPEKVEEEYLERDEADEGTKINGSNIAYSVGDTFRVSGVVD